MRFEVDKARARTMYNGEEAGQGRRSSREKALRSSSIQISVEIQYMHRKVEKSIMATSQMSDLI